MPEPAERLSEAQPPFPELEVWLCPVHRHLDDAKKLAPLDNCIACIRAERDELRAERQRLHDLVRYKRMELHADDLISDAEYAELLSDHGSVARLEGYDKIRARMKAAEAEAARLRAALLRAEPFLDEELENREASFLPEPNPDEVGYLESARAVLDAVRAALAAAGRAGGAMNEELTERLNSKFPEGCDGYICPECEPYGCSFLPGSLDLQGNVIASPLDDQSREEPHA